VSSTRIINTWDQNVNAGGDRVVIFYQNRETGRISHYAAYKVGRYVEGVEIKTDPKAAWYDYGKKSFSIWRDEANL